MAPKNKRDNEDPDDGPGVKRGGEERIRAWTSDCGFDVKDAIKVIESSGPDMSVPQNVVDYILDGKLTLIMSVASGSVLGAAIYGVYKAGAPPKNFPHPDLSRAQMYFIGVSGKGKGVGSRLLRFFEVQAALEGCDVVQVVPAKRELIGRFYKNYAIDLELDGGACISKKLPKPPPPLPLQPNSAVNSAPARPWNSFLSSLKPPTVAATVKTPQKTETNQWATFMSTLNRQGGKESGQEVKQDGSGEVVAKEKSGDCGTESDIEGEDDRECIHSDASGYWGSSELASDGGAHGEEEEVLDGNVLAGLDTGIPAGTGFGGMVDGVESLDSELGGYGGSRDTDGAAWDTEDLLDDADSQGIVGMASLVSEGVAQGARLLRSWWGC